MDKTIWGTGKSGNENLGMENLGIRKLGDVDGNGHNIRNANEQAKQQFESPNESNKESSPISFSPFHQKGSQTTGYKQESTE